MSHETLKIKTAYKTVTLTQIRIPFAAAPLHCRSASLRVPLPGRLELPRLATALRICLCCASSWSLVRCGLGACDCVACDHGASRHRSLRPRRLVRCGLGSPSALFSGLQKTEISPLLAGRRYDERR